MVLPSSDDVCRDQVHAAWMRGDRLEIASLPSEWRFFDWAIEGNREAAIQDLEGTTFRSAIGDGIRRYNRFVLMPTPTLYEELRSALDGELAMLLEIAAYNTGIVQQLPTKQEMEDAGLDRELLAWGLASLSAAELERENFVTARQALGTAIEATREASPLLAAILMAQSAHIAHHCLELPASLVRQDYEAAIELAKGLLCRDSSPNFGHSWGCCYKHPLTGIASFG